MKEDSINIDVRKGFRNRRILSLNKLDLYNTKEEIIFNKKEHRVYLEDGKLTQQEKRDHVYENKKAYYLVWQREKRNKLRIENMNAEKRHIFRQNGMHNEYLREILLQLILILFTQPLRSGRI